MLAHSLRTPSGGRSSLPAPTGWTRLVLGLAVWLLAGPAGAQQPEINSDEGRVGDYTLPDPLVMADGTRVTDAETWNAQRRPEILKLFETFVYGRAPGRPAGLRFEVTSEEKEALGGTATRKEISIHF